MIPDRGLLRRVDSVAVSDSVILGAAPCIICRSEPGSLVHNVAQGLAKGKAPAVVKQDVEASIVKIGPEASGVRRDQHIGCCPERMVGGQGLDLENVETSSRYLFGMQRRHKV